MSASKIRLDAAMASFTSKDFERSLLDDLLSLVTSNAQARWPEVSYLLNSDVAWRLPGSDPEANIRLWYDDLGIAAFAWFEVNSPCSMDLRCDLNWNDDLGSDLIDWLETRRRALPPLNPWLLELTSMQEWEQALEDGLPTAPGADRVLQLGVLEGDQQRIDFVSSQGFEPTAHFSFSLTRSLDIEIPAPNLPGGMSLRHVLPVDFAQRVLVHREAWFTSSFTLDQYLRVREIQEFDPELDIVIEAEDGQFASYCIGWVDSKLGVGSFEPVGTPPAFRRRGLGQQVNYEGLRRMKQKGMHSARIGTAGFNDRAFGLYTSCGFELKDKERTYIKVL